MLARMTLGKLGTIAKSVVVRVASENSLPGLVRPRSFARSALNLDTGFKTRTPVRQFHSASQTKNLNEKVDLSSYPTPEVKAEDIIANLNLTEDQKQSLLESGKNYPNAFHGKTYRHELSPIELLSKLYKLETLVNGDDPKKLAGRLFRMIAPDSPNMGAGRYGYCYSGTLHAIFTRCYPQEILRIICELAATGHTILKSGTIVTWDPKNAYPNHPDELEKFLFGTLCCLARLKDLPTSFTIDGNTNRQGYAKEGEMANIMTRLTGERHINVNYSSLRERQLDLLDEWIGNSAPVLAEYGAHGGSYLGRTNKVKTPPLDWFRGKKLPGLSTQSEEVFDLSYTGFVVISYRPGYIVIPDSVAQKYNFPIIPISGLNGYVES